MNHMWINPATIDEKVTVKQAAERSKQFGPYQVHYHAEAVPCEAKYRHRMFAEGHERGGPGKA